MALKISVKQRFGLSTFSKDDFGCTNAEMERGQSIFHKLSGLRRSLSMALYLILGGTICYVSLHYIPAFITPPKIIDVLDFENKAQHLKGEDKNAFLRLYAGTFNMKRGYVKKGQTLEAQYIVPEGNRLTLNIQQCKQTPILEVFKCDIIGSRNVLIENSRSGLRTFTFQNQGFYNFGATITGPDPMTSDDKKRYVVWSRKAHD